jgi:uncharacterized membrane protein YedE/YeeE
MFEESSKLFLGLITGIAFGFLLQKGRVAKFPVIVGQFLFRDWTVIKVMGTAVIVSAIGVYALLDAGAASLHIKPALWGGVALGGLCFGIGIVILGYCPGTTVAACGEGHRDAMVGLLGMLAGALLFVGLYPQLEPMIQGMGNAGKTTLPQALGGSPWLWILAMTLIGLAVYWLGEHRLLWKRNTGPRSGKRWHRRPQT